MSKFNSFYNSLQSIYEKLDDFIGDLEEKQSSIEEKALEHDRDMTGK